MNRLVDAIMYLDEPKGEILLVLGDGEMIHVFSIVVLAFFTGKHKTKVIEKLLVGGDGLGGFNSNQVE